MSESRMYFRLTHSQKGIWYTDKLYPDTSINNIAATLKIDGNIDYKLLEKAILTFIDKNEALKLRFVEIDGEPYQYISEEKHTSIDFLDFSLQDKSNRYEWDTKQTQKPFKINDSCLFYFAILKINENENGFYFKVHHLISDGWSIIHTGNEIIRYYNCLKNGESFEEEKKPSYIDFVKKEEEYENSPKFEKDREYWRNVFSTIPEITTLKSRTINSMSTKAKRKTQVIPSRLSAKIQEYSKENKNSVFALYLSALAIYINRITGKEDIVIGIPVLNRSTVQEKDTIGMFISTVPLRINVQDSLSFSQFSDSVIRSWIAVLKHHKYPYDLLLKEVREKYKSNDELYDLVLSYQNAKFVRSEFSYKHEGRWHFNGHQKQSLYIHINDREDEGNLIVDYDYLVDMFYPKEIEFIQDHVTRLLWHALDNPTKQISAIDMISEAEKNKILNEFNNTDLEYNPNKAYYRLFEEQVEKTPDAIAVVFNDRELTYRQLDARSDQLAYELGKQGRLNNKVVGIMTKRSVEMIIGIIAIMKAGGAYLPIDPEYPRDRVKYMLENSNAEMLLTNNLENDRQYLDGKIIDINIENSNIYKGNEKLRTEIAPDDLSYMIYTSGSTGVPKGVMLKSRGLSNLVAGVKNIVDFKNAGSVLSTTTMSFDIFIFETLVPLTCGMKVIIADEEEQRQPYLILRLMLKHDIDMFQTTPSRMQMILSIPECNDSIKNLKQIILGGEPLPEALADKIKSITNARLYNGYGPTETTVYSTFKIIDNPGSVNIGKPVSNTRIYILDKCMNLLPIGAAGEIYIGGEGLSLGYANKPDMTVERFLQNPYRPGEKIYKTGDLGRWYPGGEIEHLGRIDHQVKIRGLRIELGEIENQMLQLNSIIKVVVIDKEDAHGHKFLCAYFEASDKLTCEEIRSYLAKSLPQYMIPTYFIQLDKIPMTPNGKVDKRSLPDPQEDSVLITKYVAPQNEIQQILAKAWEKILKVNQIGIDDNFFDLGGDSLSIIQVQTAVFYKNWNLSTQDFYKYPTIRQLSGKVDGSFEDEAAACSDFAKYSVLPIGGPFRKFELRNVFMTGATGFLGIHIIDELLEKSDANLYCLIRGQSLEDAEKRFVRLLNFYFPDKYDIETICKRICVINGDLNLSNFGVDTGAYRLLIKEIDTVIHTAALVKHYGKYGEFHTANVESTKKIADFCNQYGKSMAYISTMSVSGNYLSKSPDTIIKFDEKSFYIGQSYEDNVYVRSKFEAEYEVYDAMRRGLNAVVLRVGNLTGRYSDGQFQYNMESNAFYNRLRAIFSIGMVPESSLETELEFTPVDLCSNAIVKLLKMDLSGHGILHVYNYKVLKMSSFLDMLEKIGIKVLPVSNDTFMSRMNSVDFSAKGNSMLSALVNDFSNNTLQEYNSSSVQSCDETLKFLKKVQFHWKRIDTGYLNKIIMYLGENYKENIVV